MKLLAVALVGILFVGFLWLGRAKDPEYQTSEYEYTGHFNNWILSLCDNAGIDPNDYWLIECPKCPPDAENHARIERSVDGWELWSFRTAPQPLIDKLEPGQAVKITFQGRPRLYCEECRYPIGTDWDIRDLMAIHIEDGTFEEIDFNWGEWRKIHFDGSKPGSSIIGRGPHLTEIKVEDDGYYRRDKDFVFENNTVQVKEVLRRLNAD